MKDYSLYEKADIDDKGFPVRVTYLSYNNLGLTFYNHWHEQMEVLYFLEGKATIECNSQHIEIGPGDLFFVNSNELHCGYCVEKPLTYYCILFDPSLLKGSFDGNCEQKYITPIAQSLILFRNKITGDTAIAKCVDSIIKEYNRKQAGYELFIKSSVYNLLGILFRNHIEKVITEKEYIARMQNLERLNRVISYIEENFTETISLNQLAQMTCLSRYHFCHLFKKLTGRGVNEYINMMRIDKADLLLKNTNMNITEIAMTAGFIDANYFSRIFKKYKKVAPSAVRKAVQDEAGLLFLKSTKTQ